MRTNRSAFTLVELLVVIAIIGVLIALLLPAVQAARAAARRTECTSSLKQIGIAMHNYHDLHDAFPPSMIYDSRVPGSRYWSWCLRLLPVLEEDDLYDHINSEINGLFSPIANVNDEFTAELLPQYQCPSDTYAGVFVNSSVSIRLGTTNYLACRGDQRYPLPGNGVFPERNVSSRFKDIIDGTSTTLLVGERVVEATRWTPWWAVATGYDTHGLGDQVMDSSEGLYRGAWDSPSADARHWWSLHEGGSQFTMADGSTRLISYTIEHQVLLDLSTMKARDIVGAF